MRTEAEVALRAPRSPEQDERVLENLLEEIERLTRLVSQLLFLCREDAGLRVGALQPVRLDEIVRDVANHMQVVARKKGLALEIAGLPPCSVPASPIACAALLQPARQRHQVHPGGRTSSVSGRSVSDGQARVVVTDSGIGIPAAHLPRVFDRFYRVDPSRSRDVDGTGLGLAICRSIAEAHGGRIRVTSDTGEGCEFTVELPIAPTAASEVPDGPNPGDPAAAATPRRAATVMPAG